MKLIFFADGGARGNPGPAATGIVVKTEGGDILAAYGEYLGRQTNNVAEYSAVISGLRKCKQLGADEVQIYVDSLLICEQLNRRWKVKEPMLQKLFIQAWNDMRPFKKVSIAHVRREKNTEADAEVNKVLDSQRQ